MRLQALLATTALALGCVGAPATLTPAEWTEVRSRPLARGVVVQGPGTAPYELVSHPWIEARSPHFVVRTDQGEPRALDALRRLETSYEALGRLFIAGESESPTPVELVLFARSADYAPHAPHGSAGAFRTASFDDLEGLPRIVAHGELHAIRFEVLQHELTHLFVSRWLGRAPGWLNEGLAEYYSTLAVRDDRVRTGAMPSHHRLTRGPWTVTRNEENQVRVFVPMTEIPRASTLMRSRRDEWKISKAGGDADRHRVIAMYLGAFALVHLLLHGPSDYRSRLDAYLGALRSNVALDVAHQRAFGDVMARLDDDLEAYVQRDVWSNRELPYKAPARPLARVQAMDEPARLVLDARLAMPWRADVVAPLIARLDRALANEPARPELRVWRGLLREHAGDARRADEDLEAALRERPDDAETLFALARVELERASRGPADAARTARLAALNGKLAALATTAPGLALVANVHLAQRQQARAIEFARRSVTRDPACAMCYRVLAAAMFAEGRVEEALATQLRAVNLYGHEAAPPRVLAELARYEEALGARKPRVAPP